MIEWQFYIDDLEIEEPIGFADLELSIIRDEKTHGIGFEASTGNLRFYGAAFTYLKDQKEMNGLKSSVSFLANSRCDEEADWEEMVRGNLNFGKYKETCGNECFVAMPIEQEGCVFTFKNRYDQKVDIDNNKSFDGITVLPGYAGLNMLTPLPAKAILAINEAATDVALSEILSNQPDWSMTQGPDALRGWIAPGFQNIKNSSLGDFNALSYPVLYNGGANNRPPYATFPVTTNTQELLGTIECNITDTVLTFRLKGSAAQVTSGTNLTTLRTKVFRLPVGNDPAVLADWIQEYSTDLAILTNTETENFDQSATVNLTLTQGDLIYFGIFILVSDFSNITSLTFNQSTESFFKIQAATLCEDSEAKLSLVHETLSRATEAITDYCVRVKSSYYGRLDSEPFAFTEDGCGGLCTLTSGLKIRKAIEDKFFVSMKDLMEGLNAIDNVGMDIIDDPDRDGKYLLRIEDLDFWYEDREMLRFDAIPEASLDIEENKFYSKILVGYKKWEVERINGLDEFNSNREYRTSLTSVSNTLDITSNLVAGSYPIEVTRQQSFAATGAADTKYDNEVFIIAVKRGVYPAFAVEQGNISNAENIFSPDTVYNFRIRPIYNLMRWYRSIVNSYPNLNDKLFFSSGTGNLIAKGEINLTPYTPDCKLENTALQENQHLFTTHFAANTYTPLWKNETVPFEYPLSIDEYKRIKAAPYGYINYQCGLGEYDKGYIKEIKYKPVKGTATFILKRKW